METMDAWRRFARALLELLLPAACACCGRGGVGAAALCTRCRGQLLPEREAPHPPPPLTQWAAGTDYEAAGRLWIRRFKYPLPSGGGIDPAAEAVCRELVLRAAGRLQGPLANPDWIVPVPLHPLRQQERGFNPAARLARTLARAQPAPLCADALLRRRVTPSQTGLSRAGRRRNVAGAFAMRRPLGGRIWLVDDVVTTGSTLAEAARTLRAGGAQAVAGICAARRGLEPR